MHRRLLRIAPLLLGSGMCALVYQTSWLRELRLIFGSSTFASAAVLAIFMGGLGLGGALLGKRADAHPSPLAFYGNLELAVAGFAAVTPFLADLVRALYFFAGGSSRLGEWGATGVRILLATIVLALPTLAMGGTLPAAARAAETADDAGRRSLAFLYAANTMGAVTGAFLSTFFLIEVYGTRTTLWLACLVNALIGLVARSVARGMPEVHAAPQAAPVTAPPPEMLAVATASQEEEGSTASAPPAYVFGAAAAVGFVFFLMELVWYRMLGPLLGGSTFTFGLILAVALLGIGAGGLAYALWLRDRRATLGGFALTCLAEAACLIVPFAIGDDIAVQAAILRQMTALGFSGLVTSWAIVSALVVFPAAFVSGIQFPLLVSLLGKGGERVGQHVGLAYAWNTVGSIIGSLAGGFALLPGLGALGTWRLSTVLLVLLGASAAVMHAARAKRWAQLAIPAVLTVLSIALLFARGPTAAWRHEPIGAGRVNLAGYTPNLIERWKRYSRAGITWETEGRESSVALVDREGLAFIVNGKSDGNTIHDAPTQVMSGVLGAILHPDARRSMVIGLGTGSTAGWLGHLPGMERVDVMEIEPAIIEVAEQCVAVNQNVLKNPKVHVTVGDARETLTTTRERYDLIFSEPSNPYRAGISSLFTEDFYKGVKRSLAPGGIFIQWMQAYEIDADAVRTVLTTLGTQFAHVEIWISQGADLLYIAREQPVVYDIEVIRKHVALPAVQEAMIAGWRSDSAESVLARFVAGDAVIRQIVAEGLQPLNTDDRNHMEFAFARNVGAQRGVSSADIMAMARRLKADRPVVKGDLDWHKVQHEQLVNDAAAGRPPLPGIEPAMIEAFRWMPLAINGRYGQAMKQWKVARPEATGPLERVFLAYLRAGEKEESALTEAEALRPLLPIEADFIRARYFIAREQTQEAVAALEAAFVTHRKHAWVFPWLLARGMELAAQIAAREPSLAPRLYAALEQPFAVHSFNEARQETLMRIARRGMPPQDCAKTVALFEPEYPWTRRMLEWRAACYAQTQHPRAALAAAELARFEDNESPEFDATAGRDRSGSSLDTKEAALPAAPSTSSGQPAPHTLVPAPAAETEPSDGHDVPAATPGPAR